MNVHQVHITLSRGEWLDLIRLAMCADADKTARMYVGSGRPIGKHVADLKQVQADLCSKVTILAATDIHIAEKSPEAKVSGLARAYESMPTDPTTKKGKTK